MKSKVMTLGFFFLFISLFSFAQGDIATPADEPTTTIQFDESEFDFGTIVSGEKVRYTYHFTNTGDIPLVISKAKGSCGCTVPSWPQEPILPGQKGKIDVEFNSKGKKGKQSKRVTITANTDPTQTYLTIKGEITKAEEEVEYEEQVVAPFPAIEGMNETEIKKTDLHAKDCFAVFPNPTTDVLKLDVKDYVGKAANIRIFNEMGQEMESKIVQEISNNLIEFTVNHYSAGTYFVSIQIGKEKPATKCFVVAKR